MSEPKRDLGAAVLATLGSESRALKPKELARALSVATHDYRSFKRLLAGMEKTGRLVRVKGHRYALPRPDGATGSPAGAPGGPRVTGRITITRRGDGFVKAAAGRKDVFVPQESLAGALDGDRVTVRIVRQPRGLNPEGVVLELIERAREAVAGVLHDRGRWWVVVPFGDPRAPEVAVPRDRLGGAREGDVVVARLVPSAERRGRPAGEVERVLGRLDEPGVDVLAVALGFGLRMGFPDEVLEAARLSAEQRSADPGAGRVDRTDLLCFTIDPADAKDHDDALSVRDVGEGRVEVGVHIADVSHFVRPGDAVDAEALDRGTSVYLVDRAIPMLPPVLSSDVCSLRADESRFAVSLFATLGRAGEVVDRRYERTVIRCRHGLSYEQAQEVLDGEASISPEVDAALRALDDHARRIRAERHGRGALDLDLPEARVVLDDDGEPIDIQRRERTASHRLIEDYMILANELVANDLEALDLGTLYRIHEPPPREAAEELREALAPFGLEVPRRKSLVPRDLQALLERASGVERHDLISTLVLRTLAKARYATENVGHFGLASGAYLHFTSPIRRYPDLVVHRVLAAAFLGGDPLPTEVEDALTEIADQSSERERAAEEAERATVALKKVEFMERHLGDVFWGRISGVTAFGAFVTLEDFFVEGLIHVKSLDDDYYRFSAGDYALLGERKGRRYTLGDRVRVQVARVDREARHIDFVPVGGRRQAD